jgi:hypothetical protein
MPLGDGSRFTQSGAIPASYCGPARRIDITLRFSLDTGLPGCGMLRPVPSRLGLALRCPRDASRAVWPKSRFFFSAQYSAFVIRAERWESGSRRLLHAHSTRHPEEGSDGGKNDRR